MAEQDIRENAMSGGTPVRLRGLAANGNSISPTLAEVVSAMPIATHSSKGIMSADQAFYLATWGTVCICLHPPTMQQLLYLLLVPIQKVLCQMQVQILTVIIQMGLKVLFSVEKR